MSKELANEHRDGVCRVLEADARPKQGRDGPVFVFSLASGPAQRGQGSEGFEQSFGSFWKISLLVRWHWAVQQRIIVDGEED